MFYIIEEYSTNDDKNLIFFSLHLETNFFNQSHAFSIT